MKNVRIIPPKPKENKKLRVAAYCRVSTSGLEQMCSLEISLGAVICRNGIYDESKIRQEVDKIQVFGDYILIFCKDGSQDKRLFKND